RIDRQSGAAEDDAEGLGEPVRVRRLPLLRVERGRGERVDRIDAIVETKLAADRSEAAARCRDVARRELVALERPPSQREIVETARASQREIALEIQLGAERIDANVGRELRCV